MFECSMQIISRLFRIINYQFVLLWNRRYVFSEMNFTKIVFIKSVDLF